MSIEPSTKPKILLVGIGQEWRQDDEIGLLIVRRLATQLGSTVATLELTEDCIDLIEAWQGFEQVYLFDAMQSGLPPGTISRIDPNQATLSPKIFAGSTHLFGLAETIELARALDQLPPKLIIYGIEGQQFNFGHEPTPEVQVAIEKIMPQLLQELILLEERTCSANQYKNDCLEQLCCRSITNNTTSSQFP